MLTIRKPFAICFSTRATLARSTRIDGNQQSSSVLSFVRQLREERRPSCIVYRFSKKTTGQTFYVQVFDKNYSVAVDDLSRQLVLKIVALVENFAVNPGYQANRFLPALRELLSTCYPTLCSTKALLRFFEPTRIINSPSVAPRHERQQPDIQSNRLIVRWQWFRFYDATETGIPHAVLTFEVESFNLTLDRTVQLNLDVANLRKRKAATQFESGLRIGEGVVAALGTKARKPRYLSTLAAKKKGLESLVHPAQRILQNLTVHRSNVLSNGFDVWELLRLLDVVDALAVRRPGLTTFLQGRVVQFSTHSEGGLHFFSLPAIRV